MQARIDTVVHAAPQAAGALSENAGKGPDDGTSFQFFSHLVRTFKRHTVYIYSFVDYLSTVYVYVQRFRC